MDLTGMALRVNQGRRSVCGGHCSGIKRSSRGRGYSKMRDTNYNRGILDDARRDTVLEFEGYILVRIYDVLLTSAVKHSKDLASFSDPLFL